MSRSKDKFITELLNLIGYGLAKFDNELIQRLGFNSKSEFARYLVQCKIASSVKAVFNRQDSFDPYFDNGRRGWYQRNQREHIKLAIDSVFGDCGINGFAQIISNLVSFIIKDDKNNNDVSIIPPIIMSKFRSLQETGLKAESFFISNFKEIEIFAHAQIEDARLWGEGFDFQFSTKFGYDLVEVKGLSSKCGSIRMTRKEFETAVAYRSHYHLVIVSNLDFVPKMTCFTNPTLHLNFEHKAQTCVQHHYYSPLLTL